MRFSLFLLLLILISCSTQIETEEKKNSFPKESDILGNASTLQLKRVKTRILLEDYFQNPNLIDSISSNDRYTVDYKKDSGIVVLTGSSDLPISLLSFFVGDNSYQIMARKYRKVRYRFELQDDDKKYSSVKVKGQMNDWNPEKAIMKFENGVWTVKVNVSPGIFQYKLVADGNEIDDPRNEKLVSNGMGGFNNVFTVDAKTDPIQLYTKTSEENLITIETKGKVTKTYVLWNNHQIDNVSKNGIISITIPEEAKSQQRSFIRVVAINETSVSNDLLIPLENGKVVQKATQLTRFDKEASILYFMMVDRFFNGESSNDKPLNDPRVAKRADYYGGDLAGILEKLKSGYFEELGMNTIWLSPIGQNPTEAYQEYPEPRRWYSGYHGYWQVYFNRVDFRFGNEAILKELVDEAHKRDMNIILDFVSNHVHETHPFIMKNPQFKTQLDLEDGRKNIRIWDEHRLTTWFDTFLPSLDFSRDEIIEMMSDTAMYWLTKYDLDGFRHDATKHIPSTYWRALTKKIKSQVVSKGKRVYQVGETFGSRDLIGSYVSSGQMDGQFDFNLYFDVIPTFIEDEKPFTQIQQSLNSTFDYHGYHSLMGNITGNHDLPRFIASAGGDLQSNEDPKEAGWQREIIVKDRVGYDKLKMFTAFTLSIPGIPVIYYGDDIGMPGANDPDNRRPMKFKNLTDEELAVKESLRKMAHLRKSRISMLYGETEILKTSEKELIIARSYFGENTIIIFNKANEAKSIEVNLENYQGDYLSNFGCEISINENRVTIEVPAWSFEVLTN